MSGGAFFFGIPLLSQKVSPDWATTCALLNRTIESCFTNQGHDVRVLVACHELPELSPAVKAFEDRITFLVIDDPAPSVDASKGERRQDKHRKMGKLVEHASAEDNCHLFILDADDVVSTSIVAHVVSKGSVSIVFRVGYVFNEKSGEIYRRERFDQFCGSACALYFGKEASTGKALDGAQLATVSMSHKNWQTLVERYGGRIIKSREPHVVYIKNHGVNLSFLDDNGVFNPDRPARFEAQFSEERLDEGVSVTDIEGFSKLFPLLQLKLPQ